MYFVWSRCYPMVQDVQKLHHPISVCNDVDSCPTIFDITWHMPRHKHLFNGALVYACLLCMYLSTARIKWTENW